MELTLSVEYSWHGEQSNESSVVHTHTQRSSHCLTRNVSDLRIHHEAGTAPNLSEAPPAKVPQRADHSYHPDGQPTAPWEAS